MSDHDPLRGEEVFLHVLLHEGLSVEVLIEVYLGILRRKRVECADRINLVILLLSNVEVVGRVVSRVLSNV